MIRRTFLKWLAALVAVPALPALPMKRASAGVILNCVNGHAMYRLKVDVRSGDLMRASQVELVDARLPLPRDGERIPQCATCGADLDRRLSGLA